MLKKSREAQDAAAAVDSSAMGNLWRVKGVHGDSLDSGFRRNDGHKATENLFRWD